MRIRIQFQIHGFDDQKDVLATGKAFILISQKRTSSTSNMKIVDFFLFLWIIFALLDPDPATQINADPQPCVKCW
jgi:hypothetical protein